MGGFLGCLLRRFGFKSLFLINFFHFRHSCRQIRLEGLVIDPADAAECQLQDQGNPCLFGQKAVNKGNRRGDDEKKLQVLKKSDALRISEEEKEGKIEEKKQEAENNGQTRRFAFD